MTNNETTTEGTATQLPCPLCGEHCCDENFSWAMNAGGPGTHLSGPCPQCGVHITVEKAGRGRLLAIHKPPKGTKR